MKINNHTKTSLIYIILTLWQSITWSVESPQSYRFERMLPQPTSGSYFNGAGAGQFHAPQSLVIAADNSIWVTDTENHRIQHLDANGQFLSQTGTKGSAPGEFNTPKGIALAADGSLWVADSGNMRFQHFAEDGRYLGEYKLKQEYSLPQDVTFTKEGHIWVIALEIIYIGMGDGYYYSHLYQLNAEGQVISDFKLSDNYLNWSTPTSDPKVKVAADNSLWVSDLRGNIWHLQTDGKVIAQILDFSVNYNSIGFAPLADGAFWLTDKASNRLQHFTADNKLIAQFGGTGSGIGQFQAPQDIDIASDGSVWVVDTGNHRLQKFTPKMLSNFSAEYDDNNQLLYLDDVEFADNHYQATLQLQHGQYRLLAPIEN